MEECYQLHGEESQARAVPRGGQTGRIWGVWNEEQLPVQWETTKVNLKDAYRIRRIYRRLAKIRGRGHLCSLTVFVRHENVARLPDSWGTVRMSSENPGYRRYRKQKEDQREQ